MEKTTEHSPEEIGFRLELIRDARNLTIKEVSGMTGLSEKLVKDMEEGRASSQSKENLWRLAAVYNVTMDFIKMGIAEPVEMTEKDVFLDKFFCAGTRVCACCSHKRMNRSMAIMGKRLGICQSCIKKIKFTPQGGSFDGGKYISYLLSPMFYERGARTLIKNIKFYQMFEMEEIFGILFAKSIEDYQHLNDFDMVIPVPLSEKRLKERGYNQSSIISKGISRLLEVKYCDGSVKRIRDTKRQSRLKAAERMTNVKGAFEADGSVKGKRIILVDDVYTTGNTMNCCAEAILEKGAKEVVGISASVAVK